MIKIKNIDNKISFFDFLLNIVHVDLDVLNEKIGVLISIKTFDLRIIILIMSLNKDKYFCLKQKSQILARFIHILEKKSIGMNF